MPIAKVPINLPRFPPLTKVCQSKPCKQASFVVCVGIAFAYHLDRSSLHDARDVTRVPVSLSQSH